MTLYAMILLLLSCTYITSSAPVDHRYSKEKLLEAIISGRLVGSIEAHGKQLIVTYQSTRRVPFDHKVTERGAYYPITFHTPLLAEGKAVDLAAKNPEGRMLEKRKDGKSLLIGNEEIAQILQGTLYDVECRHILYDQQIGMKANESCADTDEF